MGLSSILMMSFVVTPSSGRGSAAKSSRTKLDRSPIPNGSFAFARGQEISFTIRPQPDESFSELFLRMAEVLRGATIVHLFVFGDTSASEVATEAMRRVFGRMDWPITWVEGRACNGEAIGGIQVAAFAGGPVQRVELDGRVVGSVFQEGGARHCLLGGVVPAGQFASPGDQTKKTLDRTQEALAKAGFSLADTVRTWFFLDNILSWYDEFNRARTHVYSGVTFRTHSLPASTGVGARNRTGSALTLAARAMCPLDACAHAEETASPLQCPAPAYGSSFSRATEIITAHRRQLLISGTASIAPGGETLWRDDIHRQVELTMKVVEAILESRGFSFNDLTRAVAYFKHIADAGAFTSWCIANKLSSMPVVVAHCDICRDDLLFELEADAEKPI